ncbi:MAG: hypothetical protein GY868_00445 [Deltaproteobacteria bacterium]|nr:hypothetical protein [Deltaproteobacteria bacterium]
MKDLTGWLIFIMFAAAGVLGVVSIVLHPGAEPDYEKLLAEPEPVIKAAKPQREVPQAKQITITSRSRESTATKK